MLDLLRALAGPFTGGMGVYYLSVNRNKRSPAPEMPFILMAPETVGKPLSA